MGRYVNLQRTTEWNEKIKNRKQKQRSKGKKEMLLLFSFYKKFA